MEIGNSAIITSGFAPGSYECVRSLSKQGVTTIVISNGQGSPTAASRFCDENIPVPTPDDDLFAYKEILLRLASRSDVRTILPLRTADPYVFAKYRDEFEDHINIPTPSHELLKTVYDRMQLVKVAKEAGVPVPDTKLLTEVRNWSSEQIIKSRYNILTHESCSSYSTRDIRTVKAVEHLCSGEQADVDTISEEMDHVPIVQEYVRSTNEYVFGALYNQGEPLATFQHRQIRGNSYTGGGGVYRKSVDIPELDTVGRTLLDHLDWHGLACIEYMRDAETGEFKLAEINPRVWQSLPCAVYAGVDFPYYFWLQATGQSELIEPEYETGVGSHLLYGEVQHLLSTLNDDSPLVDRPGFLRTAGEIAASCYEMPHFDDLRIDDPLPFVHGLGYFIKKMINDRQK